MADPQDEMAATMVANLRAKTGKSLDEWIVLAKTSGHAKHGGLVSWLKADHGLTHGYANLVAHKTFASDGRVQRRRRPDGGDVRRAEGGDAAGL